MQENTLPRYQLDELAQKLQVSPSLLTYWRQGKRKPGARQLKKLSQLTGIKIEDLL
jgi:transcriptional regulator with XRE-family HTH domain